MDADIVREIEFSRSLRGYNIAEVDSFLERIEGMLRRRDLEQENLQKKVDELEKEKDAQQERIRFLAVSLENAQQEAEKAAQELVQVKQALEASQTELAQAKKSQAAAQSEAVDAEQRCQVLEQSLTVQPKVTAPTREELQKRLSGVGTAARDTWKQLSRNLKTLRK